MSWMGDLSRSEVHFCNKICKKRFVTECDSCVTKLVV